MMKTFIKNNISSDVKEILRVVSRDDRFFGLVVRVPVCRPKVSGFNSRRYQIFLSSSSSVKGSTQTREHKRGPT
jgi:hypothetical protein